MQCVINEERVKLRAHTSLSNILNYTLKLTFRSTLQFRILGILFSHSYKSSILKLCTLFVNA